MRKYIVIFLIAINIYAFSFNKKVINLKEAFDFGLNIFNYDFKVSSLSYDDIYQIVKNNDKLDVQTELLINWLFSKKRPEEYIKKLKIDLQKEYLNGKELKNREVYFEIINFLRLYITEDLDQEKSVDIISRFQLLQNVYKSDAWVNIINSIIMFLISKDDFPKDHELPFYENIEYAVYNSGEDAKKHYAIGNFFKYAGERNPSAHKLAVIQYQKSLGFSSDNKVLKASVLKNVISLHDKYKLTSTEPPLWLTEIVYRYTLDINPSDSYAYNNLAYLYASELNKPEEALKYALKAYEIRSLDPDILDTLGFCYMMNGKFEEARKYFEKAYSIDKDNINVLKHLSDFYLAVNQFELSEKYLRKLIKKDSTDIERMNNLAYLLAESGQDLDYAEKLALRTVEQTDFKKDIYIDTYAWVLYKKKRYRDSESIFSNIKDAKDYEILLHKGFVYAKLAEYEKSMSFFKKALKKEDKGDLALKNYIILFNMLENNDKIGFMKEFNWNENNSL